MVKVLKGKYFHRDDFLQARLGNDSFYLWRRFTCEGIAMTYWRRRSYEYFLWSLDSDSKVVSSYISEDDPTDKGFTDTWNVDLISHVLHLDVENILALPPILSSCPDSFLWDYDSRWRFIVKSCYHLRFECEYRGAGSLSSFVNYIWNKLWCTKLPRKILIFMWRALKKCNTHIMRRGVDVSSNYDKCDGDGLGDTMNVFSTVLRLIILN